MDTVEVMESWMLALEIVTTQLMGNGGSNGVMDAPLLRSLEIVTAQVMEDTVEVMKSWMPRF